MNATKTVTTAEALTTLLEKDRTKTGRGFYWLAQDFFTLALKCAELGAEGTTNTDVGDLVDRWTEDGTLAAGEIEKFENLTAW